MWIYHDHWLDETTPDLIPWSTTFCLWSWKPMARTWKTNVDLTTLPRKESGGTQWERTGASENAWGTGVTTLLVHLISPLQLQSESATCLAPNHVPATPDTCPHTCHLQASPQRTQLWLVHTRNFGIVCTVLLTYCHSKSEAVICSGGGNNKCALCGSTYSMAKAWHPPLFAIGPPPTIHTRGENAVNYITTRVLLPP